MTDEGGGAQDKGDYSQHAGPVAQLQQSNDYAEDVTDKGVGALEKGDYSEHAGPVATYIHSDIHEQCGFIYGKYTVKADEA